MARASNSATRQTRQRAAEEGAHELAKTGDENERQRRDQNLARQERREIGAEAGKSEEYRGKQGRDHRADLAPDRFAQNRGFADQDARDEGAEHRLDADRLSEQRQGPHDEKREA